MAKIALSSSQILNIALGLVIVVGGFASVQYGNFGGVSFDELTEKYISKYSDLAIQHQKKYRIPASITLAQGLLESTQTCPCSSTTHPMFAHNK